LYLITSFSYIKKSLETVDNGKPYNDAVGDIEYSVGVLRYYAGWSDKMTGTTIPIEGKSLTLDNELDWLQLIV